MRPHCDVVPSDGSKVGQNYVSAEEAARQQQGNRAAEVRNLEADVVESTAGSRDECELLYRKIVSGWFAFCFSVY